MRLQTLVVEINHARVDAIVQSYLKKCVVLRGALPLDLLTDPRTARGKKLPEQPTSTKDVDQVDLKLLGLPVGDRTIDTSTTISVKYLQEIVRESKTAAKKDGEKIETEEDRSSGQT